MTNRSFKPFLYDILNLFFIILALSFNSNTDVVNLKRGQERSTALCRVYLIISFSFFVISAQLDVCLVSVGHIGCPLSSWSLESRSHSKVHKEP